MMSHGGVAVVAHDPDLGLVPSPRTLGVVAHLRRREVHGAHGVEHLGCAVAELVRELVDPRVREEGEVGPVVPDAARDAGAEFTVEAQPAREVAAEVGPAHPHAEGETRADALPRCESAAMRCEGTERSLGELEEGAVVRGEVPVRAERLDPDVAAGVGGPARRGARPVPPADARHAGAAGMQAHEEGGVRGPRDGGEDRTDRVGAPLLAQPRECGKVARVHRREERVRAGAVGHEQDEGHAGVPRRSLWGTRQSKLHPP